jgi:probable rRNA maturation factor
MPLTCEVLIDAGVTFQHAQAIADLIQFAADREPAFPPGDWQMALRLCDDATIAELHEQFFDDPTPTDVITFPAEHLSDGDASYLGDVIVSVETAVDQAVDAGNTIGREVAFLGLHGLLHLCGYDDGDDHLREKMLRQQQAHLEAWEAARGTPL